MKNAKSLTAKRLNSCLTFELRLFDNHWLISDVPFEQYRNFNNFSWNFFQIIRARIRPIAQDASTRY